MRLSEALDGIGRPIAYFPRLAKFLGGVKVGVHFCQLWYWSRRAGESGEFWKSLDELCEETGLTPDEERAARKLEVEKGLVKVRYARFEHRLYFRINDELLDELFAEWLTQGGHIGNSQMAGGKIQDGDVGKVHVDRVDPEITSETINIHTHASDSASPSERAKEPEADSAFASAWREYPKRKGTNTEKPAHEQFVATIERGIAPELLVESVKAYAADCREQGITNTRFVMQASKFFGVDEPWREFSERKPAAIDCKPKPKPRPGERSTTIKDGKVVYLVADESGQWRRDVSVDESAHAEGM
jgi:hypothetical protein